MIRVIYKWRVDPENLEKFESTWRDMTRSIHATVDGALGSFCLQEVDDPSTVLTVALWENEAQWRAFMGDSEKAPLMKSLHEIAEQISATPYKQLGDETISPASIRVHGPDVPL